jgi:hypothetical protein
MKKYAYLISNLVSLLVFLLVLVAFSSPHKKINSVETLIEAMHKRFRGKAAKTVTFTQYNTHYQADTISGKTTWYEAIAYPNNFRIDFGDLKDGNAVIFSKDSVFNFKEGKNIRKTPFKNNLILLAGGMNFMEQSKVLAELKSAGYDLSKFREDTYQGKPVFVVGADANDFTAPQFWIDQKNLYLVRTFDKQPNGDMREARFNKHIKSGKGWIETEVWFFLNGKKMQLEEYKEVKPNAKFDERIFDAAHFGKVHWKN